MPRVHKSCTVEVPVRYQPFSQETEMNKVHRTFQNQGLIRPREGRVLGGVVAGLGRRFGISPWPARLLFIVILMVIPGSQILVYPILWILMPSEQTVTQV